MRVSSFFMPYMHVYTENKRKLSGEDADAVAREKKRSVFFGLSEGLPSDRAFYT